MEKYKTMTKKIQALIEQWEESLNDLVDRLDKVKQQEPNVFNEISIPMMTGSVVVLKECIKELRKIADND